MRYFLCGLTILVAVATTGGIGYLLGHSRALGHEDWQFETRLARAYADEIPFHAGPLGFLAVAAVLGVRSTRAQLVVLASTIIVAALALYETRETVRAYILTTPGKFVSEPAECTIILALLWLAAIGVLIGVIFAVVRRHARRA